MISVDSNVKWKLHLQYHIQNQSQYVCYFKPILLSLSTLLLYKKKIKIKKEGEREKGDEMWPKEEATKCIEGSEFSVPVLMRFYIYRCHRKNVFFF